MSDADGLGSHGGQSCGWGSGRLCQKGSTQARVSETSMVGPGGVRVLRGGLESTPWLWGGMRSGLGIYASSTDPVLPPGPGRWPSCHFWFQRDQEEGHLGDISSVAWTPTVPSENTLPSGPCRGHPDWNQGLQFALTGRPPGGVSSHGRCASCPMQHRAAREPASHRSLPHCSPPSCRRQCMNEWHAPVPVGFADKARPGVQSTAGNVPMACLYGAWELRMLFAPKGVWKQV